MTSWSWSYWCRIAFIALLPLGAGCYESSRPLGPAKRGVIHPGLTGAWLCKDPENESNVAKLTVMAFDERRYYAEWREDGRVSRYAAHSSQLGEDTLLNVRELKGNSAGGDWVFMRARRRGQSLELSVVKEDPLKDLTEDAAFRAIKHRVKEDALYGVWAQCQREQCSWEE